MAPTPSAPLVSPTGPRRTENARGIAYMALGMFVFSAVDTQAKFLTESLHTIQIVWSRQMGIVIGIAIVIALKGPGLLRTKHPVLQVTRGFLAVGSAATFIFAISFVPLADAVAVSFVAPFIVTVLGALILKEPVGIRRWAAVTIGFLATLIVIRPGTGVLHPAVFLVIIAAAFFALRQIVSRWLSGSDTTITTLAYTGLVSVAILTIPLPFVWQWPATGLEITLLISIALMTALGETMVIKALEVGQAVVVAPLQYTLLIWSTGYGFLVFGDLPDLWTWVGALIIVATGLYTLHRERVAAQR